MVTPYKNVTQELPRVQKKDHKIYTKANHACKVASESKPGVVCYMATYIYVCALLLFSLQIFYKGNGSEEMIGKSKWTRKG